MKAIKLFKNTVNGIWTVQLYRPERMNALSEVMGEELIQLFREELNTSDCRGILIKGDERAFSTGRDLKLSKAHSSVEAKRYLDLAIESVLALYEVNVPTCAVVEGHAIGWGMEFAMAADFRIVSNNARFRLPETSLGLFPGAGGIVLLPRLVGETKAKELIFTAKTITAQEAVAIGLASAPIHSEPFNAAEKLLSEIAENAPLAIKAAKRALRTYPLMSDGVDAIRLSRMMREPLSNTIDHREALEAYADKRKPTFIGK